MKRLIPATVILIFIISLCFTSHFLVNKICNQTIEDINKFRDKSTSAQNLENTWKKSKEKLSIFVNHGFLDDVSVYISQLTLFTADNSSQFDTIYKNIETMIDMIKEEQRLATHSFY